MSDYNFVFKSCPYELHVSGDVVGEGATSRVLLATGDPIITAQHQSATTLLLVCKESKSLEFAPVLYAEAAVLRRVRGGKHMVTLLMECLDQETGTLPRLALFARYSSTLSGLVEGRSDWKDSSDVGRDPLAGAAGLLAILGRALSTLSLLRVCHRDLKPENLAIDAAGRLLVGDFGAALDLNSDVPGPMAVGTRGFHGVEAVYAGAFHDRIDRFSAGCVIGYVLASHSPFMPKPEGASSSPPPVVFPAPVEEDPGYRRQMAANFSRVLAPPSPEDVLAMSSNLPSLATDLEAGGHPQEATLDQIYGGRCNSEEERAVFLDAMTGLLRYSPFARIPPWDIARRFMPRMTDEERGRFFGDVSEREKQEIRQQLAPGDARELLSYL